MLTVLTCLTTAHDYRFVGAALAICIFGCIVSMRLFSTARNARRAKRGAFVVMAGIAAGLTIWSTHFLAMLGFMPDLEHGFDPHGTLLSLGLAVATSMGGLALAAESGRGPLVELGGAVVGGGIALMHFVGMTSFEVPGSIEYEPVFVGTSIALGLGFGALALNRVSRPVTRFCRYGGAAALALAIGTMHFTAMGAVQITPDPRIAVPPQLLSDGVLAIIVLSVTSLVVLLATITYLADQQTSEDALAHYRHLATHDPLTGLPNRAGARETLAGMLEREKPGTFAVIAIDLNRFKEINDVFGHAAGDAVLSQSSARLREMLEPDEFIARVGGDEFVAYKSFQHAAQIEDFCIRIGKAFAMPTRLGEATFTTSASIGIATFPKDGHTSDQIVGRADLAMYRAKESREGRWCWYAEDLDEDGRRRGQIAIALKAALERRELHLAFQPQIGVKERQLLGFEALLRWTSTELGLVSPSEFIPVAEKTGLILEIGDWVMVEACTEAVAWPAALTIAVNVSPLQMLRPNFVHRLREILVQTGLDPRRLEVEITETTLIDNPGQALHVLRQLRAMGVRIAMDDFGTGYSSLSTMFAFPFDKLKVDRGFLMELHRRPQAASVIETVIELGHKLAIPVLAEGVETDAQAEFLRARGCDEAQGYLFGRPIGAAEARALAIEGRFEEEAAGKLRIA
jgi:diguanylate cyclase (GGDEF)-like protein